MPNRLSIYIRLLEYWLVFDNGVDMHLQYTHVNLLGCRAGDEGTHVRVENRVCLRTERTEHECTSRRDLFDTCGMQVEAV